MQLRELTNKKMRRVRKLVKAECANYDHEYGCLPLGGECFMFGKAHTYGAMCRWFRAALLPLDAELGRVFSGDIAPDAKPCVVCGRPFPLNGRQTYCSDKCAKTSRRKSVARNVAAHRNRKRRGVIN